MHRVPVKWMYRLRSPFSAVIVLAIAACAAPSVAVPASERVIVATASPVRPSAAVAPTPSQTPEGPHMVEPNSAAVVAVATLNVREHPGTAARLTGTLAKGDVVFVYAYGPTVVDGYDWFQASQVKGLHDQLPALPDAPLSGDWSGTSGWIAVATTTATYVTALAPRCPTTFDLRTIQAMLPGEQLSCLGGRTLTLEGTYGCPGCGGAIAGVFSPQWLAFPQSWDFISVNVADRIGPFAVRFPPDVPRPAAASVVRVRGHFDDPRASSCSIALSSASDSPLVAVPPDQAMLVCRQHFVVTDYEVIGTDPSFPPF